MIGCDLHLRSMLLCYCVDDGKPQLAPFANDANGRAKMLKMLLDLAKKHGSKRIVFAYEASGLGYGLCELIRARIDVSDETTRIKLQILSLFKRRGIEKPSWYRGAWSKRMIDWLREVAGGMDEAVILRCPETSKAYQRIRAGKKNRTKKALVAIMRLLVIKMWHRAQECGVSSSLEGRGGPHSIELSLAKTP